MDNYSSFSSAGSLTKDNLFAGQVQEAVGGTETIVGSGATLVRGTVLGLITASGKLCIVNSANADGSQTPYAILAEDVVATAGGVIGAVYYSGEFNVNALVFGGSDTYSTHRVAARKLAMFFRKVVKQ